MWVTEVKKVFIYLQKYNGEELTDKQDTKGEGTER